MISYRSLNFQQLELGVKQAMLELF